MRSIFPLRKSVRSQTKQRKVRRTRCLAIESLEPRQVLAASLTATLTAEGLLRIVGTENSDRIFVRQIDGRISIKGVSGSWSAARVVTIGVHLYGGDDYVSFNSIANGGNQILNEAGVVKSGDGNERVRLADRSDVYFAGLGHTLKIPRNGCVTLDGVTLAEHSNDPPTGLPWVDSNLQDAAIRYLTNQFMADGALNRADMLALFEQVKLGGSVTTAEFQDLSLIVNNSSLFTGFGYVRALASNVVLGDSANAHYRGSTLGNLKAGSSATRLDKLVNKWFLGLDRPVAKDDWGDTHSYRKAAGSLFVNGAAYTDVRQGGVGDCYYLAALAETALRNPNAIQSMFIVNGDGTYTVRFYNGNTAEYVTVDSYLPTNSYGYFVFANMGSYYSNSSNELWVALAEKAYVQINESGWLRPTAWGGGLNNYIGISGGWMGDAMEQVTGQAVIGFQSLSGTMSTFAAAFNSGKSICLGSKTNPSSSTIVGSHAYAVISVNTVTETVQIYNPWGLNNGHDAGLLTLSWSQIQANFSWYDRAA